MSSSQQEQLEAARRDTIACENKIQSIKAAIKKVDAQAAAGGEEATKPNSMEVSVMKVEGLPESAQPTFSLQLSSPVEELVLTKLYDPLVPTENMAVFTGVDTSMATLTLTVKDAEIVLGSSEATDVAPLCPLDAMTPAPQYVSEIPIAIVSEDSKKDEEEEVFDDAKEELKESLSDEVEKEKAAVVEPVCVVTLRVTYKPSIKDQKEELFDLLNKASHKKAESVSRLRRQANAASSGTRSTETSMTSKGPAVKRGFLNKKKAKGGPGRIMSFYNSKLGPQSWARQAFWVAKNYVIFFGAAALFHWRGQEIALPPPV